MWVRYTDAYLPNMTQEQKRDPMISPLFMNLNKLKVSLSRLCTNTATQTDKRLTRRPTAPTRALHMRHPGPLTGR